MQTTACWIVAAAMGAAPWAFGQGGTPKDVLQEKLNARFALTTITADRSDIVAPGAVLVLQKNGLVMYSVESPLPPSNTYKNGKISQGGSGFGRDLLITMAAPGGATANDYPHRNFVAGEGVWLTGLTVQKDGIIFRLYSDAYDGVRYYGQLKFPFQKNAFPEPEQALATIAEALTLQQAETSAPPPAPTAGVDQVAGEYVMAQAPDNRLQLNTDGTFSLVERGRSYSGAFKLEGNHLMLLIANRPPHPAGVLQGDTLLDPEGSKWVRQTAVAPPAPVSAPGANTLQNDDIIKMTQAGFDDATILAKIGASKCLFDTSTDALILLKQNGVTTAVLRAMVNAGK